MVTFRVVHIHEVGEELRERFRRLDYSLASIREEIEMTISPKIQQALDAIRQTQDLTKSALDATKVLSEQNGALQAKVTELQGKLDAGGTIGADDLAALAEISSDIDMVNAQLRTAIPANTPAAPSQPADQASGGVVDSNPATGANVDTSAQPEQPTAEEIAQRGADAGSAPKPLAGTGQ